MASRAARTPTEPEKKPLAGFYDDCAALAMPAQDEDIKAGQQQSAARGVARWSMRDAHGCTGKRCRSPQHAAAREVRNELLDALGVGQ
jgi:hypothetical protein